MVLQIRSLQNSDYEHILAMETGMEEDYIPPIFSQLTKAPNKLYGLFVHGQLACFAGYTVFSRVYIMIGRLRSDVRMRGKGYATTLIKHIIQEACKHDDVFWIGANTQADNHAARRILEVNHLQSYPELTVAHLEEVPPFENVEKWQSIHPLEQKKAWLKETYIQEQNVFPFQPYYPFPASKVLFTDDLVEQWNFYENHEQSRYFILKHHHIGRDYLQLVYPWDDLFQQKGLWKTVAQKFQQLRKQLAKPLLLWMDLTDKKANKILSQQPIELSSSWVLYGEKASYLKKRFSGESI